MVLRRSLVGLDRDGCFDRVLASFGFWEPVLLPWFGTSRLSFSFLVPLVGLPRAFFSFRSPFWIPGFGLPEQDSMVVAVAPRWVRSPFRTVHRTWCRRSKEAPLPRRRKGYGSGRIVTHQEKTRTKSVGESKESPPVVRTLWYRTSWTFRALLGANFDRSSLDRNVRPSYGKPNEGSEALRTYGAQAFLRYEGDSVAARDQSVPWRTRAFDPFVPESREDSQTPKRGVLSQRFGGIPHGLVPSWVSKAHCLPSRPIPSEEPRYVPGVGKALAPETVRSLSVPKPLGMRKGSAPCLPFGLRRAFRKPKSGKGMERCLLWLGRKQALVRSLPRSTFLTVVCSGASYLTGFRRSLPRCSIRRRRRSHDRERLDRNDGMSFVVDSGSTRCDQGTEREREAERPMPNPKAYEARYRRNTNEKHPRESTKEIEVPNGFLTESLRSTMP